MFDLVHSTVVPMSQVGECFARTCRDRAHRSALRLLPSLTTITFEELGAECLRIESAFAAFGIEPGSTVVSLVGNRPIFISLFVACMNTGVALAPLGGGTDAEVSAFVEKTRATAIITDRNVSLGAAREQALATGVRLLELVDRVDKEAYGRSMVLKLTSGSTALPKAALASESSLVSDGNHVIAAMGIGPDDVNYVCIPLSHSYAMGNVVMPLVLQGSPAVLRQSFSPTDIIRDLTTSEASVFPGVPYLFDSLRTFDIIEQLPKTLRLLITAGAPIDHETVTTFMTRANRKIHSFYGSSETGGISYDDSLEIGDSLSVGSPMPETTVTVREVEGSAAGRIFIRGTAVASCYAIEDDVSPTAFVDGGFLSGDLGYFDDRQRLILCGRVSRMINVAGRKVDPAEVHRRLLDLAGVVDAHVFGVASDTRGEEVAAILVRADSSLSPLAVRHHCAERLSAHKIPRRIVFVDRLPVDERGKFDLRAMQQLALDTDSD